MAWILQKGIVRVGDQVIESIEFTLGVRRMKSMCLASGIKGGKQAVREQVIIDKFIPEESSVVVEHTKETYNSKMDFMETNFASYFRLGELDLAGLDDV
ncbi:unnamed protein product [Lactuca saligna]|uniref:Uncharacterized protein n=1 Tax=Lactuca saligna TaxID=75948 RepID=A0AA35ZSC1_LACSI|nr:unnamed protein product [Lactuca saligna]